MTKKFLSVFMLLAFLSTTLSTSLTAQSKTINDITFYRKGSIRPIVQDKIVKGYYSFYQVDRVDRKKREYLLEIMNENLEITGSKKMILDKWIRLSAVTYNGQTIMMKFFNSKEKEVKFKCYDTQGELVYTKTKKLEKKWELTPYANYGSAGPGEIVNTTLFPVKNAGFVEYSAKQDKKLGYEIRFLGNSKETKGWTRGSKPDSDMHESAIFIAANENVILSQVSKQKSRMSTKDFSHYLLASNALTGKRIFEKKVDDPKYDLAILNAYLKEDGSDQITVLGQFFKKGDNVLKDKSLGLFSFVYDKEGKIIHKNYNQWVRDIGKFVDVNDKGKMTDVGYFFFHEIVQTEDGKIFAVAETFRKDASALGIAGAVLGVRTGVALVQITTGDLAVFEFTPEFDLKDVKFYEKSKSNVQLPEGYGTVRVSLLGKLINNRGGFDYAFTQRTPENDEFIVGYVDYQKNKGARNETVFGALAYSDNEFTTDKIQLSQKGESTKWVYQAKPGYILLLQYNKKEKSVSMNLEKINF